MSNMARVSLAVLFLGAGLIPAAAQQQPTPEQMEMAYTAARNQLGVLKYCQEKGYTDGTAVEVQTKLIGLIPAPADASKADSAEESGKQGKVSAMGVDQDFAASAKAQNVSEEKLCQTLADTVKQAASQLPN